MVGTDAARKIFVGAESLAMTCGVPRGVKLPDVIREAIAEYVVSAAGDPKIPAAPYVLRIVRRYLKPGEFASAQASSSRNADPFASMAKKAMSY